jgi:hypothetical protein
MVRSRNSGIATQSEKLLRWLAYAITVREEGSCIGVYAESRILSGLGLPGEGGSLVSRET